MQLQPAPLDLTAAFGEHLAEYLGQVDRLATVQAAARRRQG